MVNFFLFKSHDNFFILLHYHADLILKQLSTQVKDVQWNDTIPTFRANDNSWTSILKYTASSMKIFLIILITLACYCCAANLSGNEKFSDLRYPKPIYPFRVISRVFNFTNVSGGKWPYNVNNNIQFFLDWPTTRQWN